MSWKLSYHVTTMDNKIINNKYDTAPTFNDTIKSISVIWETEITINFRMYSANI